MLDGLRDLAIDDTLRETFGNRGLADARLANQYRVVLRAALQNLNRAANFLVAADDRVDLALLGALGQVDGVFLERLAGFFGVGIVHFGATAKIVDSGLERLANSAGVL